MRKSKTRPWENITCFFAISVTNKKDISEFGWVKKTKKIEKHDQNCVTIKWKKDLEKVYHDANILEIELAINLKFYFFYD